MQTGAPVLLIPGLMAADWTMRRLGTALRRDGHATIPARIGLNVGCTTELMDRLEERLDAVARVHGRPAAVVGWSRGGTLGKLVAIRSPRLVAGLITLGSPNVDPLAVSRTVTRQIRVLSRLNAFGLTRMLGADCLEGECAQTVRGLLERPFPESVPYVSIYSKSDPVVDWRSCRDPAAQCIEVRSSHFQLAVDARINALVVRKLRAMMLPATSAA